MEGITEANTQKIIPITISNIAKIKSRSTYYRGACGRIIHKSGIINFLIVDLVEIIGKGGSDSCFQRQKETVF